MRQPIIWLFAILMSFAGFSYAQATQTNLTPQQQIEQKIKRYQKRYNEIEALRSEVKNLTGSDAQALNYLIAQKQLIAFESLDNLVDQAREQPLDEATKKQLESFLMPIGGFIADTIKKEQKTYKTASAKLDQFTIDGFELYMRHNEKQDLALTLLVGHLENLKLANLEDAKTTAYVKKALTERAELLTGKLEFLDTEIGEIEKLLALKPEEASLLDRKTFSTETLKLSRSSLEQTISHLLEFDINTDYYQQALLASGGEISSNLLHASVITNLINSWFEGFGEFFAQNGGEIIFKIFIIAVILYLFIKLSNVAKKVLYKSLDKSNLNLSSLMKEMIVSIASRIILIIGILIALAQLGISLAPILAGLGVAGFIIGFALQDTLGNFASGLMILIYRPYDVKDVVEVAGGVSGEVKSMNLVSTTILTFDNQTLVLPNSKIWGDVIKNVTAQKVRRVDMVFGIGYSDDIAKAERVLQEIVDKHEKVLPKPARNIKVHVLNSSSVDFIVRPWVKTADYWDVYWDITREVKLRFDQENISIPFPQQDVHLYKAD
ncbi:mechanosensitive ion channel family protein [Catenovulum sp. SM1970]|uniref:mechanosensitive ion channel family protein n=1 Tax=Marinifaba aquimaris TaxID=2741323 RepID=UPI0015735AC2|nr:mechanosensitive ion channel family protein [Marinifaba aquimaris]NTS75587.1 mechanosensitive ion channel family protein [Marinifaba aquimaris]